jgi:hypothetical protein
MMNGSNGVNLCENSLTCFTWSIWLEISKPWHYQEDKELTNCTRLGLQVLAGGDANT